MYSKSAVTGLVSLCVFAGGLSVSCASALARNTYGAIPSVSFGSGPCEVTPLELCEGKFSNPTGVAVNEVTIGDVGDVYVVDQGNNRVERFSSAGSYLGQFNGSDNPSFSGGFSAPTWIAVDNSTSPTDPSAGDVYVIDSGHDTVEKFSPAGAFLESLPAPTEYTYKDAAGEEVVTPAGFEEGTLNGVTVDSAGNVLVLNHTNVDKYDDAAANAFVSAWSTSTPEANVFSSHPGFGVDANGHVYLSGTFEKKLVKFSGTGVFEGSLSGACTEACTAGLAVDQATGELFVARAVEGATPEIQVLNAAGTALQPPFAVEGEFGGLAVNATSGDLYVADSAADDLKIYAPATLAEFTVGSVSNEQPTTAIVSGTVGPNGLAGTCEVEYGMTTSYGMSVPCSPEKYAAGTAGVPVTATLTGLASGETYHYRFAATNSSATGHGDDQTFRLTPAPLVDSQPGFATSVSQFTATLNGSIDPYNLPTSYHFVYGTTTAYGASVPTPDLYTPVNSIDEAVTPQTISGLQPGTTYHFALVATAPGGTVIGPDETFTTPGIALPEAVTGAASGATEGAVTLTGSVNPQGWETTYQFQYGTTTAYGGSWPTVGVQAGQFNGPQGISIYLQNLQPATTYHYRLLATNAAGTTYGADQTFTTTAYPVSAIQEPTGGPPKVTPKPPVATKKALTNTQKLAAALKACKKRLRKQQAKCEAQAKKRYKPAKGTNK